jgi:ABC-2 type transport system ATP-binding protein
MDRKGGLITRIMEKLTIDNLKYSYTNKERLFDKIHIELNKYSIIRLFGENGSGKTTLLKIIANIIDDQNLDYDLNYFGSSCRFKDIRKYRVFVPDSPVFYEELTMKQNVKFFKLLFNYGENFTHCVYDKCKKFNVYKYIDKPVKELSLGTRQKIFLSINLSIPAELVLLDEPFNSLDLKSRENLSNIILQEEKKTFIIVSHEDEESMPFTHMLNSSTWSINEP